LLAELQQRNDMTIKLATVNIVLDKNTSHNTSTTTSIELGDIDEILQHSETSKHDRDISTPILHTIKNMDNITNTDNWKPTLNNIIEETVYDINQQNDNINLTTPFVTSSKQQRSNIHKLDQHHNHIATAPNKGGLYRVQILSAQHDGGANRSVTSSKDLLLHFEDIPDYAINGVKEGEPAIVCTGRGFIPWRSNTGEIILVRSLYCPQASGTILSPSDINAQYSD
jgi:hypothetical protein